MIMLAKWSEELNKINFESQNYIVSVNSNITEEIQVSKSLIDDIFSLDDGYQIIVYNNDTTPFQLVFYVFKNVVPMSDQEAYDKAFEIHTKGSAVVYRGAKTHCHKIGDALSKINVTYIIEN